MSWSGWVDDEAARIRAAGRWRQVRTWDLERLVSFASNDYLGLSRHPALAAAACEAAERWGTGAGAARLVVGSRPVHDELEAALAAWKGAEAALLFPTGYAANVGVLTAFGGDGVRILSDELNHASIVDGCRLARAKVAVYRHLDLDHVASLLAVGGRSIVVSDTVFSMDGDVAPVRELVELCAAHDALLVLDEAHAVLGPHLTAPGGAGAPASASPLVSPPLRSDSLGGPRPSLRGARPGDNRAHAVLGPHLDLANDAPVLRVGTLSKALGAQGGFVVGPRAYVDLLVNRARPFVFSTALAPPVAAAALAAVGIVQSAEGEALVARLRALVDRVAPGRPSPIVPVVLGEEGAAVAASEALLERGIVVPAIRPPTVPPGTSRLRVALSAAHTDDEIARLEEALCVCC